MYISKNKLHYQLDDYETVLIFELVTGRDKASKISIETEIYMRYCEYYEDYIYLKYVDSNANIDIEKARVILDIKTCNALLDKFVNYNCQYYP